MRDPQLTFVANGTEPYLVHRVDGVVLCQWLDGRMIEVVPKADYDRLRAVLLATQKALREMQAQRDKAREGKL